MFSKLIILLVLPAVSIFAREVTLTVADADLELPLEGATVILQNDNEIICDNDGTARLSVPDNAPVRVVITYPGYNSLRFLITETENNFTARLHLSGGAFLENKELIFTEDRNPPAGIELGRGVALPKAQLDLASEIGLIEDVMSGIKLLPGVGYAGFFNAQPSIRGGEPGDLTAVLDGFYISDPYHWGGAYSIFDPKMIESATLSHGVFSARYSHTVSGILDVVSKKSSNKYSEAELAVSTSAFNIALSRPIKYNAANPSLGGGFVFSSKITYWDPYVEFAKGLSEFVSELEPVKAVTSAPYIRSGSLSANYRWNNYLAFIFNGYFGSDGVSVEYHNADAASEFVGDSNSAMSFTWDNTISFISASLSFNPSENMIVRGMLGASVYSMNYEYYDQRLIPGVVSTVITDNFQTTTYSAQGRGEIDWELNPAFLLSFGYEELFRQWNQIYDTNLKMDMDTSSGYTSLPVYAPSITNNAFFSSGWTLLKWTSPRKRYSVETGLRLDHVYFFNNTQKIGSEPVVDPRINFDFRPLYNNKYVDGVSFTVGTGMFSTMNDAVTLIDENTGLGDLKQARSWTSVAGIKLDFFGGLSLSLETYYKYGFNRSYYNIEQVDDNAGMVYFFDGTSHVGGFELMLQRFNGKKINGWLAYSFNYARYNDPNGVQAFFGANFQDNNSVWYYPEFHRFHNINLVVNYRLNKHFNLWTRCGYASGTPGVDHAALKYENPKPLLPEYKYKDVSTYSDIKRNAWAVPLDIKLSYYFYNIYGKTQGEFYCAIENTLVLALPKNDNKTLNIYTGNWEEGGTNVGYELPIPMVSFGFKWSY